MNFKQGNEEIKDCGISWLVACIAFIAQALSMGFFYSFGSIFVEILHVYDASETEAGKTLFIFILCVVVTNLVNLSRIL